MLDTFSGNIKPHSIEEEIKDSFLSYAMSVIVSRASARSSIRPVSASSEPSISYRP